MKKIICTSAVIISLLFQNGESFAQNVGINISGAVANATALLDIDATNKGLLIPRMTICQRTTPSCAGGLLDGAGDFLSAVAAQGLLVYQTDGTQGFYYNTSTTITPIWAYLSSGGGGDWLLLGNSSTVDGTNFLGTIDDIPLNFRVFNNKAGRIDRVLLSTFFGYQSGNSTPTGTANTGFGYQSLFSNTTGGSNTALGYWALYNNVDGVQNTATGVRALYSNTSGDFNTATGRGVMHNNTSGIRNTAAGLQALYNNTTGTGNTAYGNLAGDTYLDGVNNTFIGNGADVGGATLSNCIAIAGSGNLGITASNTTRIGSAVMSSIGGQVGWTTVSDARTKMDVQENVTGLAFINALRPVTYFYDIEKQNELMGIIDTSSYADKYAIEKIRFSGFLAQEVDAAAKNNGYDFSGVDKTQVENGGLYGLRYAEFVVPLVKGMQEQQKIIEEQMEVILQMEKRLQSVESALLQTAQKK